MTEKFVIREEEYMVRPKFSSMEFESTGKTYPGMPFPFMGMPEVPETPVQNRPISPLENWKLMFQGKKPYWIPNCGWFLSDTNQFRPRINPDNVANHQVFDGGPKFPYENYGDIIRSSWFDLDWCWVGSIGGATVYPGKPKVPDITKWEDYVSMPNLDEMDWVTCAKQNVGYLGVNKMNQLGIQCGLWERLMALMDVVEASIALYDDDLKPSVHKFFNAYTDFLIEYIRRMTEIGEINSLVLHEDWAHQLGPFFSPDTAREMLLPYIRKIVDYCHSRDMSYEIHCCGACELLIPVFIETGADIWGGQPALNDLGGYAKKYKDSRLIFGIPIPDFGPEADELDVRNAAREWVEEYRDCRIAASSARPLSQLGEPYHPKLMDAIYEFSRIAYQDED